jgi:hypothetical protein
MFSFLEFITSFFNMLLIIIFLNHFEQEIVAMQEFLRLYPASFIAMLIFNIREFTCERA